VGRELRDEVDRLDDLVRVRVLPDNFGDRALSSIPVDGAFPSTILSSLGFTQFANSSTPIFSSISSDDPSS
jgi:hypothetical protein